MPKKLGPPLPLGDRMMRGYRGINAETWLDCQKSKGYFKRSQFVLGKILSQEFSSSSSPCVLLEGWVIVNFNQLLVENILYNKRLKIELI